MSLRFASVAYCCKHKEEEEEGQIINSPTETEMLLQDR